MYKTILITGSTDGIGKLAALKLAKEGHSIVLHGRNADKLNTTLHEIIETTSNAKISSILADLSDLGALKSIEEFLKEKNISLNVLVNNAGIFKTNQAVLENGMDVRFVVNYLAPYYLTHLLLPYFDKEKDARIINLSSAAQESVSIDALMGDKKLSAQSAYAQSKLALTMWSFHLGQTMKDVTTIAVNPGSLLNTKMVQEAYGRYWSSADKGANIIHLLATNEKYKGLVGQYFDNDLGDPMGVFGKAHGDAYNAVLVDQLMHRTTEIINRLLG